MPEANSPRPRMLVRQVHDHVHLLRQGKMEAAIVAPTGTPWQTAAKRLASGLGRLAGKQPEILNSDTAFDRDHLSLVAACRGRPLIFIGHAGVNPALLELYARRIFVVDDAEPDHATVQTYGNPWGNSEGNSRGNGQGVALVGASSPDQIDQAVDRFLKYCQQYFHGDSLALPRIFNPGPDPLVLAAHRQRWQRLLGPRGEPWYAPLRDAAIAHLGYEEARLLHEFTVITDLGVFDERQVHDLEQAMLDSVLQIPGKVWWYPGPNPRNGRIGGRHENFKAPRLLLLVRHLLEVGRPDDQARRRLEEIRKPLEHYLDDVLTHAYRNDHEGSEATTGWEALVWAALAMGKSCYFTSGRAYEAAFHAFLETDNLGASASHCQFGGVEDIFQSSQLRLILRSAAWWYHDGRFRWLLENMPYVTHTSYSFPLQLAMEDVPSTRPDDWLGLHWLPVSDHSYESSVRSERWSQPAIPRAKTADVLSFRSGFTSQDQYLAIDGFQNHFQPLGLGSILRYVDLGKLFLVAHTGAEGNYYKSGLAVSCGVMDQHSPSDVCEPWGAELATAVNGRDVALAALRCPNYHGVDWTRHVIWRKGQYFLLIDHVAARAPGLYTLTATWRTGFPAAMEDDHWMQHQNPVTFYLKPSKPMASHAGQEPAHLYPNEVVPFVLRQHDLLQAELAGDQKSIVNLIYATSAQCPRAYEIASLTENTVAIHGSNHTALAGHGAYEDEQIILRSPMFHVSDESAVLAGPAEFWLHGRNMLKDMPTGDVEMTWQASEVGEIRELLGHLWDGARRHQPVLPTNHDPSAVDVLSPTWELEPFTGHHQPIAVVVDKDDVSPENNQWAVELDTEHDLHEVIVECAAEKLVGGEYWPELNTEPAHPEPITLDPSIAQAARLKMIDDLGSQNVVQGTLIHRYVGPYNKSCYVNQPCIQFTGARARRMKIALPQGTSLKSVSIHGAKLAPAEIVQLQACDPEAHDGRSNLICRTADDQIALISPTGQLLWRRTFDRKILAMASLKLSVSGQREIVISDAAANLWRISQDNHVLERTVLCTSGDPQGNFFNQGHTQNRPYALGTWQPTGELQPALFMGTYQSMAWRTADGRIICWPRKAGGQTGRTGIAWRGLIYWDRTLHDAVDLDGDGVDDQVVFGRGFATPPSVIFLSGRTHEVFAEHPFPNGWTLGLERVMLGGTEVIVAANEFQLGIYSLDGQTIRTLRFDTPAAGYALDGDRLYVAKRDGMLLSSDGQGRLVTKTSLDGPLQAIVAGQTIVVAGQGGLHLMTRELVEVDRVSMPCSHLLRLHDGLVAAATLAGQVVLLPIE